MKRFPWDILLALLIGLGLGLAYAWIISPQQLTDSAPATLRTDFKDQFRVAIAASYNATGNLPRARARLELLSNDNLSEALNAQAQREIASGQFQQADQLAALAIALDAGEVPTIQPTRTFESFEPVTAEPSLTPFPSPADIPFDITETPPIETSTPVIQETQFITPEANPSTATPRPTRTALPTQGPPFRLTAVDEVCDPNLLENLLQVIVYNSNRRQLAGIKIIVTWDTGGEEFFTGFKPELGNGYADFVMTPGNSYAVQLGIGSEIATETTPPTCRAENGEAFNGGYKLTFEQP
ncbi:MAG TPA: hypothetical protein VLA72_21975 [Anaerolineales bacterium]|nr:hypothetical protein [Anaerolineales bacterium]